LWIIKPGEGAPKSENLIYLEIQSNPIPCKDNSIFVYDGLIPDLQNAQSKQLMAVFCDNTNDRWFVESKTGYLSIYYTVAPSESRIQGFNAMYSIHSCSSGTCKDPFVCVDGKCTCKPEEKCTVEICPSNCYEPLGQGKCDTSYGRCICSEDFYGSDCSRAKKPTSLISTELFNTQKLSDKFEHLRKTMPRFGHSLAGN
jgi:hypothetical protein